MLSLLTILQSFVLYMPFLYFPDDKREYIPAAISMSIFIAACILVFMLIKRVSKKEEEKTKELEEKVNRERQKHL
ncbi:hypothetical protein KHA95_10785 [Bacillus sp. FJAT-50079]|nr:hypothetical protein [Bacillus sp. FJAT-50079]